MNKKVKCVAEDYPKRVICMQIDDINMQVEANMEKEDGKEEEKHDNVANINLICQKCNKCFKSKQNVKKHSLKCTGLDPKQCQTFYKLFSNSKAKGKHNKVVNCKRPLDLPETLQEENIRLKKENEMLKSLSGQTTINNNNNNTTNNINIVYNNYDKPNIDHITNKVMKRIYEMSQRDPVLILNETVRRIYNNDKYPENRVIKIAEKAAFSRVIKDGKEICIPVDGVIQTVMSNTGELCADRLRECHEEGGIIGDRVVYVWKIMEVLGTDDREDDAVNRSLYFQSIKSAFM
jgi:hypothetical protein